MVNEIMKVEFQCHVKELKYLYFVHTIVVKIAPIGTRTRIVILESGALPACPFPAGTLIICCATAQHIIVPYILCVALTL